MPRPITLGVIRKTRVPSKKQIVHSHRSDWKRIYKITYEESKRIFKVLNGDIETEGQFCKYILEKFGEGIYYFRLSKFGQKGFRNFLYVELRPERFRRLQPSQKTTDRKRFKLKKELDELQHQAKTSYGEDREDVEDQIEGAKEDLSELNEDSKKKTRFPYPYLTSSVPVYSWHGYENVETEETPQEVMRLR